MFNFFNNNQATIQELEARIQELTESRETMAIAMNGLDHENDMIRKENESLTIDLESLQDVFKKSFDRIIELEDELRETKEELEEYKKRDVALSDIEDQAYDIKQAAQEILNLISRLEY